MTETGVKTPVTDGLRQQAMAALTAKHQANALDRDDWLAFVQVGGATIFELLAEAADDDSAVAPALTRMQLRRVLAISGRTSGELDRLLSRLAARTRKSNGVTVKRPSVAWVLELAHPERLVVLADLLGERGAPWPGTPFAPPPPGSEVEFVTETKPAEVPEVSPAVAPSPWDSFPAPSRKTAPAAPSPWDSLPDLTTRRTLTR